MKKIIKVIAKKYKCSEMKFDDSDEVILYNMTGFQRFLWYFFG